MSGTIRYFEFANDWAGCHEGRCSKVLCPPPPPLVALRRRIARVVPRARGGDGVVRVERQVGPADGQHPPRTGRPGHLCLLLLEVSRLIVTPRAHAAAGVAGGDHHRDAERRLRGEQAGDQRPRRRVLGHRGLAYADETDMTSGSGAPLLVAWSGAASIFKKPSTSPSSASSSIGWTQRSNRSSCGATIETTIASSELSRIGLMPEPL